MTQLARLWAKIVVDLGTRAARPRLTHLPEVVFFVERNNAIPRDAGARSPEFRSRVIFSEYRDPELVNGQLVFARQQGPCVIDCFLFEIRAERKVAQHFEKGLMAARAADVVEIVVLSSGAHAFLRTGGR